mmetsp:Transcript_26356/g.43988  ORF Transcript_26356/g.43988 Transcript_26356/m.43988 type:complete len:526 (-) Transcript_26356:201-1778(-)
MKGVPGSIALLLFAGGSVNSFHFRTVPTAKLREGCSGNLALCLSSDDGMPGDINPDYSIPDMEYSEMWFKKSLPEIESRLNALNRSLPNEGDPRQWENNPRTVSSSVGTEEGMNENDYAFNDIKNDLSGSTHQSQQVNVKLPLPGMDRESLGLAGGWVERNGNFVLKPSSGERPAGVVHFLGGAFVGAAPHITYKYMLETLADQGYLVVATPYRLDMDYIRICDTVLMKFDTLARQLAEEYGPLPVIGIGHSCGALLQSLITSLFPDTPRAVNILISFNNRPAKEAIPTFEELVIPLSQAIMGTSVAGAGAEAGAEAGAGVGNSISNDGSAAGRFREYVGDIRRGVQGLLETYADSPIAPRFVGQEILPLWRQGMEIVDQLPDLLQTIASGQEEFSPSPGDTKEVCRRMYRARQTLVLKFANDDLDESEALAGVLREANTIMRMKRPMVELKVDFAELAGSHITPLTPNLLLDVAAISQLPIPEALNPAKTTLPLPPQIQNAMQTIQDVNDEIAGFLDRTIKSKV